MDFNTAVTLVVTLIMGILFLTGKFPFGLVTISCCSILVITGVLDVQDAFSGFCNQTVIMTAAMMVLGEALAKTSLVATLKSTLTSLANKSGILLVICMLAVYLAMSLVMPGIAVFTIMLTFIRTLPREGEVCASRMILPMLMFNCLWEYNIPIGSGAMKDFSLNAYMGNIVTDPSMMLAFGDKFRVALLPGIIGTLYVLYIWKKFPKTNLVTDVEIQGEKAYEALPKWKDYLIYIVYIVIMVVLLLNTYFSKIMYIVPVAGVCVLRFAGALNSKETISSAFSNVTLMLAGVMGVTTALSNTGAIDLVADLLLPLISWTDNAFIVYFIIAVFITLMTTFLSNGGTIGVMTPLLAGVALAGGMNPRPFAICVGLAANYAFMFPSGSTTCALAYSAGNYDFAKTLKYTLPLAVLLCVGLALSLTLQFDLFL